MDAIWKSPYNASFEGSAKSVAVVVRALYSATTYDYRFAAEYVDSYRYANYDYSYNETFLQAPQQFRTKRDAFYLETETDIIRFEYKEKLFFSSKLTFFSWNSICSSKYTSRSGI